MTIFPREETTTPTPEKWGQRILLDGKFMEKLKQYKYIILIVLTLAFYWFEFRPYLVKKNCFSQQNIFDDFSNKEYHNCLHKNGL